jgi:hypothetical protein
MKLKIAKTTVWDSDSAGDVEEGEFAPIVQDMRSGSITPTTFAEREMLLLRRDVIVPVLDRLKTVSDASAIIVKAERDIKLKVADIKGAIGVAKASHDALLVPVANVKNTGPLELNDQRLQSLYSALRSFLDGTIVKDKAVFFKDTYSHNTWQSEVVRFGLNINASGVKADLTAYNGGIITLLNDSISHFNTVMQSTQADTQSQTSGGSAKSSKAPSQQKTSSFEGLKPQYLLHPAEIYLVQEAINYFRSEGANVVLVDIFARASSGMIKDDTHTIVLFKNPDGKLIVIDPSNSSLSSHIADSYNIDIFAGIDFYVPKREIRIYEGDKDTGYRDCVDIAVKIASGLQQHSGGIKLKKIIVGDKIEEVMDFESIPVIHEVTNRSKLNPNFSDDMGVVKIRQASDIVIREKIDSILPILQAQERFL